YQTQSTNSPEQQLAHALATLYKIFPSDTVLNNEVLTVLAKETLEIKKWVTQSVYTSKAKDYKNTFKNMVYDSAQEMESVLGSVDQNSFISEQNRELQDFRNTVEALCRTLS